MAHFVRAGCKKLIDPSTDKAYSSDMGWGTFIAGQAIGAARRAGRRSKAEKDYKFATDFLSSIINKRTNTTIGLSGIAQEKEEIPSTTMLSPQLENEKRKILRIKK